MELKEAFGKFFGSLNVKWALFGVGISIVSFLILTLVSANISSHKIDYEVKAHLSRDLSENNLLRISEYLAILIDQKVLQCSSITKNAETLLTIGEDCENETLLAKLFLGQRRIAFVSSSGLFVQMKANLNHALLISYAVFLTLLNIMFFAFLAYRDSNKEKQFRELAFLVINSMRSVISEEPESKLSFNPTLDKYVRETIEQWKNIILEVNDLRNQRKNMELSKQLAHDLRTPLAALRVATSEAQLSSSHLVVQATDRLDKIISSILSWNSPDSQLVSLYPIVKAAVDDVRTKVQLPNLHMIISGNLHSAQDYKVPEVLMYRIINNLVQNAAEAIENSRVGSLIEVKLLPSAEIICVVEDNGPGIAPKISKQLLRTNVTYGKPNGNGLGLMIVRDLVQKLGCVIECTTKDKTIFTIRKK